MRKGKKKNLDKIDFLSLLGLKTSAQWQNNGSTYDGKTLQSALTHPSIINKSSADWILSIKRCHDAICPRRAAWHCGLNHKCDTYYHNEQLYISILSPKSMVNDWIWVTVWIFRCLPHDYAAFKFVFHNYSLFLLLGKAHNRSMWCFPIISSCLPN